MTRNSIKEYVEAIRERYQKAGKEEKGKIPRLSPRAGSGRVYQDHRVT